MGEIKFLGLGLVFDRFFPLFFAPLARKMGKADVRFGSSRSYGVILEVKHFSVPMEFF